jgi:hypothetical protein
MTIADFRHEAVFYADEREEFAVAGAHSGAVRMRGVGEPIWPGRGAAHLEECQWHEALINRAFAELQGFWLICPQR